MQCGLSTPKINGRVVDLQTVSMVSARRRSTSIYVQSPCPWSHLLISIYPTLHIHIHREPVSTESVPTMFHSKRPTETESESLAWGSVTKSKSVSSCTFSNRYSKTSGRLSCDLNILIEMSEAKSKTANCYLRFCLENLASRSTYGRRSSQR